MTAAGEAANFDLHGEYRELRPFVEEIKRAREGAGLTLAEVSRRCGIDQPVLSRLENAAAASVGSGRETRSPDTRSAVRDCLDH